jgi:DNA gyrase subunit A
VPAEHADLDDHDEADEHESDLPEPEEHEGEEGEDLPSQRCYRTQRRGGKGLRDIKTTDRNGPVIGIVRVHDEDELLIMTARGKIQRIRASDISIVGRNTQGVRIMSLDEDDTLVAVKRVPKDENEPKAESQEPESQETESQETAPKPAMPEAPSAESQESPE